MNSQQATGLGRQLAEALAQGNAETAYAQVLGGLPW